MCIIVTKLHLFDRELMEQEYTVGAIILYLLIEMIKYFIGMHKAKDICLLSTENQRKLDDLHSWHNHNDDEGRKIWYVPKHLHMEQEKIVEMLRDISKNQENTARLLGDLIRKMKA